MEQIAVHGTEPRQAVTRNAGLKPGKETPLFTATTLAAMLVHADARARATGEAQNITWERTSAGVDFNLLTSREIEVLREQNQLGNQRPYMTVLANGSLETHRITSLPPEANAHV